MFLRNADTYLPNYIVGYQNIADLVLEIFLIWNPTRLFHFCQIIPNMDFQLCCVATSYGRFLKTSQMLEPASSLLARPILFEAHKSSCVSMVTLYKKQLLNTSSCK